MDGPFPEPYSRSPIGLKHTHTAILLHDHGSSGYDLASEIFTPPLDDAGTNVAYALPGWRWVFPTARYLWSSKLGQARRSWFEGCQLMDPVTKRSIDEGGMQESVEHILYIIHREVELLGGVCENLLLFGHGQGAAVGLWALLCRREVEYPLPIRGFVGLGCWLPCAQEVRAFLLSGRIIYNREVVVDPAHENDNYRFVRKMMGSAKEYITSYDSVQGGHCAMFSMRTFLLHSTDNLITNIKLGREVRQILSEVGFQYIWFQESERTGEDGHWFKEQEHLSRLVTFFEQRGRFGEVPRTGTALLDYTKN